VDETVTDVTRSRDGRVGTVTVDRAGAGNSLTADVLADLRAAVEAVAAETTAVVLRTAGDEVFTVGADLDVVGDLSPEEYATFQAAGRRTLDAIEAAPAVVVAAVDGPAVGGGTELVCAVDLAVAAADATFALPEATIGLVPGGGATQRLPRLVGPRTAMAMLTTGDPVSAAAAERAGLVNRVVESDAEGAARDLAASVADNPTTAVAAIKDLVRDAPDVPLDEGLDREAERSTAVYEAGDARERIAEFLGDDGGEP
jgi:enoyl-CoA hydratase/carnithine racemase